MNLPVRFRPDAKREYYEAVDWSEANFGTGVDFVDAVQKTLDRITANPKLHAVVYKTVRKAIVSGYRYYCVFYSVRRSFIEIVSVFHTSRDPKLWQSRV